MKDSEIQEKADWMAKRWLADVECSARYPKTTGFHRRDDYRAGFKDGVRFILEIQSLKEDEIRHQQSPRRSNKADYPEGEEDGS